MEYTVNLLWDKDAAVWVATSDDIIGLVLESGSLDVLMERVKNAVPDLLKLNHQPVENSKILFKSEDEYDITIAEEAYNDYIKSGCKSTPIADFWKELDDEVSG